MFEYIRTHQRLMQFLLMLIILPSFAMFGLSSYTGMRDSDNVVAKVDGQSITQQEWDMAQREQMENLRQRFGKQFDARMFDTPEAKQSILDNLISQRVLAGTASRQNLTVSDEALQKIIQETPDFKNAEGKFDPERYDSLLAANGLTHASYDARLRQGLIQQQVNAAIQSTAFAPKAVATRLSDLNDQERDVQELSFKYADFVPQVKITDEMLKAYYNQNGRQFEIPEQVTAEYVVLSPDALASQITVNDTDVKAYYDQNIGRFTVDEQRRASHILIAVKKDAPAAEKDAAKAKAEKLLAQVRKDPHEFARLAKENSNDPGSAEHGGDLDFFGKGMMVKPFEEAAYKLKKGEISDLVQSDFGYHVIQLTDVKPGSVKTLDEVKAEIIGEIKKQQAVKKYSELAETFTNTVYEQADSLKPVAEKLKLKIETAANLTRQPNPALPPTVPYNSPKFLKAIFSDEAIKNKRNTEAVEAAPNVLIAAHVLEYKPAAKRPFEEVQALVRASVTQTEAKKLAKAAGEAKLAALKTKDDSAGFGEVKSVSRSKPAIDGAALRAVMKADASKLPAFVGLELPGQGYSIFRMTKVAQPATVDAARRQTEQQQVTDTLAQQEMVAYLDLLKEKSKVKIIKTAGVASADVKDEIVPETKK